MTLVVAGDAFMSQHIGDLEQYEAMAAHRETIDDLIDDVRGATGATSPIVHDLHPEYASTAHALGLDARRHVRGPAPSRPRRLVLAERGALEQRVLGVALDGTGYGDDGTIWGGEIFVGSVAAGLERIAHLRSAPLPGGDAAARHPVQAAAGFLAELDPQGLDAPPFSFPARYFEAAKLLRERNAHVPHHLDRPPVRHRRRPARLPPRGDLRGSGRDLARAPRSPRRARRST